jgi:hypothetical protein
MTNRDCKERHPNPLLILSPSQRDILQSRDRKGAAYVDIETAWQWSPGARSVGVEKDHGSPRSP